MAKLNWESAARRDRARTLGRTYHSPKAPSRPDLPPKLAEEWATLRVALWEYMGDDAKLVDIRTRCFTTPNWVPTVKQLGLLRFLLSRG